MKSKSEQRLEELEAIQRPLTEDESWELRRCLHAIYMMHWRAERAEREMNRAALDEHNINPPSTSANAEVNAIAGRMDAAHDESWPLPIANDWDSHARTASAQLRDAIFRAAEHGRLAG